MKSSINPRLLFGGIFLVCATLIGYALYLQYVKLLEPCPMCILQRIAFAAIGVIALFAAISKLRARALIIYGITVVIFAVLGGAVAIRHSWVQHFPPESQSCGGADLEYLLSKFPLSTALPQIFQGTGDCSKITWSFLGLTLPEWALVWFFLLAAAALYAIIKGKRA